MSIIALLFWTLVLLCIASIIAMIAKHHGVSYLIGAFAAAVVIVNVISGKLMTVGSLNISAGILIFSVTFLFTDIISEFWGKAYAKKAVWSGFLGCVLFIVSVYSAIQLAPASFWDGQEAFAKTLGSTARITIASLVAYIIAQSHDVWAYQFWKKKFNVKYLWLRNNCSTGLSQVIDSVLFVTIAFWGVAPVLPIIFSTIVVKWGIAMLDTPFIYAVRWYFERCESKRVGMPIDND